jgi:thiazole synthase ThiGH ThiG subunit
MPDNIQAPPASGAASPPDAAERLLAAHLKLSELWHLIAVHVSDDRSAAVPDPLMREAARYLAANAPAAWEPDVRWPGPARDSAARALANGNSAEQLETAIARAQQEIETARSLFRAVADLVDPIDPIAIQAELAAARTDPSPKSLSDLLTELEHERG